jgi:HK97 gp10 family phage protein
MARAIDLSVRVHTPRLQKAIRQYPQQAEEALAALAHEGESIAKMSMGNSVGKVYSRGGQTRVASKPGDPPNVDKAALINSIATMRMGKLKYAITAGTEHAVPLEFGTSKMAARPFFRPMAHQLRGKVTITFKRLMKVK